MEADAFTCKTGDGETGLLRRSHMLSTCTEPMAIEWSDGDIEAVPR